MQSSRQNGWLVGGALLIVMGCASAEEMGEGEGASSDQCRPGNMHACMCEDGRSGARTCQLDGTLSVCNCNGAQASAGAGVSAAGANAAGAGTAAVTSPVAGMMAAAGAGAAGTMPLAGTGAPVAGAGPAPTGIVNVPPEDVSACTGMGSPATPEEAVEMIPIRTSDAVPGGYNAVGGTVYACFWVEIDMPEKHHIIGWEGAIGGDRTVHHQQVSLGQPPAYLIAQGQGGLCGLPTVDYTWTGGQVVEWTPALAGYPIGGPENGGKARFLWQTHFEGATTYTGGFNVYITKQLRKYDAANFEQGDVRGIMIPPGSAHTHVATCTPDMTTQKLVHPIYVFASMQHAHLTIQNIKGEQFRDGQHMATFGNEQSAGFGFFDQRFKPHSPCIEVLPGDELVTTCDYMNPFNFEVTGGEATNQEMCTTFMQYFPRLPENSQSFCGTIDSSGGFSF